MGASSGGGGMGGAKSLSEHQRMQRDAARVSGPGRSPSSRGIPGTSGYAALNSGGGGSSGASRGTNYGNFRSVAEARAAGAIPMETLSRTSTRQSSFNRSSEGAATPIETRNRTSTREQVFNPPAGTEGSGVAPMQTLRRETTKVADLPAGDNRLPSAPTLKLTQDGLLLLNDANRETSERVGSNQGQGGQPQNENIPQPTPTPPSEPSPPAARPRQRAAPLARPRIDPLRDNTLLTLSLADVTRKTLLGV